LTILRRQIKKRFGSVPKWAEERLAKLSAKELEELSVRVLDAKSIKSLSEIEVQDGGAHVCPDEPDEPQNPQGPSWAATKPQNNSKQNRRAAVVA
jgi:hypothetical protein